MPLIVKVNGLMKGISKYIYVGPPYFVNFTLRSSMFQSKVYVAILGVVNRKYYHPC